MDLTVTAKKPVCTKIITTSDDTFDFEQFIKTCVKFVKEHTKTFDGSHDHTHGSRVAHIALNLACVVLSGAYVREGGIIEGIPNSVVYKTIIIAGTTHDLIDEKYTSADTDNHKKLIADMTEFYKVQGLDPKVVFDIIGTISYSKEKREGVKCIGNWTIIRDIVKDADRLDALGVTGLARMFMYGGYAKQTLETTIKHFYDKIIHIPKTLVFSQSRDHAKRLLKEMRLVIASIERDIKIAARYAVD